MGLFRDMFCEKESYDKPSKPENKFKGKYTADEYIEVHPNKFSFNEYQARDVFVSRDEFIDTKNKYMEIFEKEEVAMIEDMEGRGYIQLHIIEYLYEYNIDTENTMNKIRGTLFSEYDTHLHPKKEIRASNIVDHIMKIFNIMTINKTFSHKSKLNSNMVTLSMPSVRDMEIHLDRYTLGSKRLLFVKIEKIIKGVKKQ